jgi:tubulin--tyrosine ligase-like protein 12
MARSMDTWVSNNLDQIVRLYETGPKIAQKYIERPITFKGRKIDLRYVVLLKSVLPLQVYVCEEFYIRFSNN